MSQPETVGQILPRVLARLGVPPPIRESFARPRTPLPLLPESTTT